MEIDYMIKGLNAVLIDKSGQSEEIIMIIGISNLANQNYFSLRHKVEDIVEY